MAKSNKTPLTMPIPDSKRKAVIDYTVRKQGNDAYSFVARTGTILIVPKDEMKQMVKEGQEAVKQTGKVVTADDILNAK